MAGSLPQERVTFRHVIYPAGEEGLPRLDHRGRDGRAPVGRQAFPVASLSSPDGHLRDFFQHQLYGDKAGQTQVNLCIQGSYQDLPDLSQLEWARTRRAVRRVLDSLMEDSRELLPGLEKALRWEVRTAAVYGLSESPGIAGRHRPPMTLPGVRNLFLASDTVRDARGVGMQAAASVALKREAVLFPSGERERG